MIRETRNYWCEHCPKDDEFHDDVPVPEGTGFVSLRELGEHIESEHPREMEQDSVEEFVEEILTQSEGFIHDVIDPAIEAVESQKSDQPVIEIDWNESVDGAITRFENARKSIRRRIREERNALNREYFHELAERYADHWASAAPESRSVREGLCSARAMAHEAEEEIGYYPDHWMCLWYLEEALPENHPSHDPESTVVNKGEP